MALADFQSEADRLARRYGLDPDLFRRTIQAESGWRPDAVSSADAIGLGQLMPGTASDLGVDPRDWRQNLDGAARYLKAQMDTFGDPRLALAAYNAGPRRVKEYGGIPPFAETQSYVRKIMGDGGDMRQRPMSVEELAEANRRRREGLPPVREIDVRPSPVAGSPGPQPQQPQQPVDTRNPLQRIADVYNESFGDLELRPNRTLVDAAAGRNADVRERQQVRQQGNRTAAKLAEMGHADLAQMVEADPSLSREALAEAARRRGGAKPTSAIQNYEYLVRQGVPPEVARERSFGGGGVNINMGDEADPRPQIAAPPKDYEAIYDEERGGYVYRVIPNSETAREMERGQGARERSANRDDIELGSTMRVLSDVRRQVESQNPLLPTTGLGGAVMRALPGTPAADMEADVGTLKARAAFDELQRMRENSPTGGAVGQLTDQERKAIADAISNLDTSQTQDEFLKALDEYERIYLDTAFGQGKWRSMDGQMFLQREDGQWFKVVD